MGCLEMDSNINLLFLGDYVDRGKNRLNVINLLITLELILVIGLHDTYRVITLYKIVHFWYDNFCTTAKIVDFLGTSNKSILNRVSQWSFDL